MLQPQLNNNALSFANCSHVADDDDKGVENPVAEEASFNYILPISLFILVVILGSVMFAAMMMKNKKEKKRQEEIQRQILEERERERLLREKEAEENAGFMAYFGLLNRQ